MKKSEILASIIIRTKNEEDWIGHCLEAIINQSYKNYEIIIVDNQSSDNTVEIAKSFSVKKIVSIKQYLPGKSLNAGIRVADGDYLVFISSHCVPRNNNWLKCLLANFNNRKIAGVYGRQVPTAFSKPNDIRDLYITFGLDKRIQTKDYFFHNANSAIRKDLWETYPFDEKLTNIEDRVWAKQITEKGYKLIYEPEAEVFHSHGIHQDQKVERANSTIKVLKSIEKFDDNDFIPKSMHPNNINISLFVPITKKLLNENSKIIVDFLSYLKDVKKIKNRYLLVDVGFQLEEIDSSYNIIQKPLSLDSEKASLGELLKWSLNELNDKHNFPDYILYLNPDYVFRPKNAVDRLIEEACFKGLDSVVYGYRDYSNYFIYNDENQAYKSFGDNLLDKKDKRPIFKSLYGLGCLTKPKVIRTGKLISKSNIGIIPVKDYRYTLRYSKKGMKKIIEKFN